VLFRSAASHTYTSAPPAHTPWQHGQIYGVNASGQTTGAYTEALTTYAVGRPTNPDLAALSAALSPHVEASRLFDYDDYSGAAAGGLQSEADNHWPIGADAPQVVLEHERRTGSCLPYGLAVEVDLRALPPAQRSTWEQTYTGYLLDRVQTNQIRRKVAALAAASTNTDSVWSTSADPDMVVLATLQATRDATGVRPNRVIYGTSAWTQRLTSYRAQDNAGGYASAALDPTGLGTLLQADVTRADLVYRDGAIATLAQLLGPHVYLLPAFAEASLGDLSAVKTFWARDNGVDDTGAGGTEFRVYLHQVSELRWRISVHHWERTLIVGPVATLQRLTVTAS
jgi:hypothetical protein